MTLTVTVGELRKEIEKLPDSAKIIINTAFEKLYLDSCIAVTESIGSKEDAYLELNVFEVEVNDDEEST